MLNYWLNRCTVSLRLEIPGPLLIKDPRYDRTDFVRRGIIPSDRRDRYPDSLFVCHEGMTELESAVLNRRFTQLTPYLPATSLAGMFRCQAERALNSLNRNENFPLTCDPLNRDIHSQTCHCADRLHAQGMTNATDLELEFYRRSCPACRLFGNRLFRGPFAIEDANLQKFVSGSADAPSLMIRRTGGIDRVTGGLATGTLATVQAIEKSVYSCQITVSNFEIWHLGILSFLIRDLEQGLLSIGGNRSLGFGKIIGTVTEIKVFYFGPAMEQKKRLLGIAELLPHRRYDFLIPSEEKSLPDLLTYVETKGFEQCFKATDLTAFRTWIASQWKNAIAPLIQQRKNELRIAKTEK